MEPPHGEAFPHLMPRRKRKVERRVGRGLRRGGKGWWRVEKVEVGRRVEEQDWSKEGPLLLLGCPASLNASRGLPSFTTNQKKGVN